jgi:hypothetical protein
MCVSQTYGPASTPQHFSYLPPGEVASEILQGLTSYDEEPPMPFSPAKTAYTASRMHDESSKTWGINHAKANNGYFT